MKIVVCIKQVPDTKGGVKFNPDGTLDQWCNAYNYEPG